MEKLVPWQFESGAIHYSTNLKNDIYINRIIQNYLEIGNHDHNFLLVGPKGIGKTLFINLKSHTYRQNFTNRGVQFYPYSGQLCENLILDNNLLSKEDLLRYAKENNWIRIWRLVLSIIACQTTNITLEDPIIQKLCGNTNRTSISSLLTTILSDRSELDVYFSGLQYMTKKIEEINNAVCIFLDNIDQAFEQFLMEYHYSDYADYRVPPSVQIWNSAQTGLLAAIYDLNRHNSHLKIYATLRSEAIKSLVSSTAINYTNYCVQLKYSKEEVKKIFEKNIDLIHDEDYVIFSSKDQMQKFLGVKSIGHKVARTPNGIRMNEPIFEYLYRHSFGRPRELVLLGHQLYNNVICSPDYKEVSTRERIKRIRAEVNKVSEMLLEYYLKEIIPKFDMSELYSFIKTIQSNVVPSEYVLKSNEELLKKYFAMGLIGFIQRDVQEKNESIYFQKFLPVAEYSFKEDISLPNTKYFITHPCLDKTLSKVLGLNYYNPHNIIGRNKKFIDHIDFTKIYDVAFSYANTPEERQYVEEVADNLNRKNVKVFYDHFNIKETWGADLTQSLSNIYNSFSKFCVIFISKNYVERKWTQFELEEALKRHKQNKFRYLLPVRFDKTPVPEIKNLGYLNSFEYTPSELADMICLMLKENSVVEGG